MFKPAVTVDCNLYYRQRAICTPVSTKLRLKWPPINTPANMFYSDIFKFTSNCYRLLTQEATLLCTLCSMLDCTLGSDIKKRVKPSNGGLPIEPTKVVVLCRVLSSAAAIDYFGKRLTNQIFQRFIKWLDKTYVCLNARMRPLQKCPSSMQTLHRPVTDTMFPLYHCQKTVVFRLLLQNCIGHVACDGSMFT